jgi:CBS domain-containing protein
MAANAKPTTHKPTGAWAATAADIMTPNPLSLTEQATLHEAAAFFTDNQVSAAPVINHAGRPVGVVSRTDLVRHDRETVRQLRPAPTTYYLEELTLDTGESLSAQAYQVESPDRTTVREVMTPVVHAVPPTASARQVVQEMLTWKVHRVFVAEHDGTLIGTISALDVLRHLPT